MSRQLIQTLYPSMSGLKEALLNHPLTTYISKQKNFQPKWYAIIILNIKIENWNWVCYLPIQTKKKKNKTNK